VGENVKSVIDNLTTNVIYTSPNGLKITKEWPKNWFLTKLLKSTTQTLEIPLELPWICNYTKLT